MNADFRERVTTGFAKQGFMSTIGAGIRDIQPGSCSVVVPYSARLTQQHGFFHAGVTATLADNAAGFAAYSLMHGDEQPLTAEFKISLVAPARGDELVAKAKVLKSGRRLKFVNVEVFAIQEERENLVAAALATIVATKSVPHPDRAA